ncbi:MAG: HAMP domain-containing protein, partial [Anaerolineae bacterium]|nr:HAMP domain-containing protein [Anaerolineae bacterium]
SIYGRSLRVRFVFTIIPVVLLSMVFSIVAVASRAVSLAREQSLVEMGRSASNASDGILHFYYTGLNLIATFADDVELLSENPDVRGAILEKDRQIVAFFQELLLTDATGQVITAVPQKTTAISLTTEEKIAVDLALDVQISQFTHLTVLPSGEYGLTVVWPVIRDGMSETQGVLMGRVQLDVNPEMRRALEALQYSRTQTSDDVLVSQSYGFILDNRSLIVAHPDKGAILRPFEIPQALERYTVEGAAGSAYDGIGPGGEQVLFYSQAVEGTPYTVVLQLPFSEVLETATLISSPILWIQLLAGVVLLAIIPFLATQITKPLNTLAEGAHQISQGNLDIPVKISREDEVAQLGGAFEQMRLRLKDRLNDLSLLLDVSQKVSATLDLEQGVPPILEGALKETGAVVARFVIIHAERPTRVLSVGLDDPEFRELDKAFTSVLVRRRTEPLISEDLSKSGSGPVPRSLRSIAAFPVRTQNRTVAILWVGGASPNAFDSASVNFLSTLASQAAVLVDNTRLFQAAEGERRRLAAILSSTIDAILVTDRDNQLLLVNPALQNLLDIDDNAYGVPVNKLEIPESLAAALIRDEGETDASSVIEIPMPDGRTFYASIAPIMDAGGSSIGQVVVMRDITHFKELDEMKSDFVETVSHDLRRPLTSIQGYATMLMMVGELNDQQQKYIDHILDGSNRMRELIEDLLNLGRIEAGLGLLQESCRLGLMLIEVVNSMTARATAKGLELHLEPSEGAPTVIGDCTLLRQAISNLVDNAIKYTPAGGQINVGLEMRDNETLIYIADTGIGIAHEDQIRLFEKFYRIKRRETSEIPGTGLGLALVRSIVERHNGRVWVESELNQGTTFYIVLPFVDEDDA